MVDKKKFTIFGAIGTAITAIFYFFWRKKRTYE